MLTLRATPVATLAARHARLTPVIALALCVTWLASPFAQAGESSVNRSVEVDQRAPNEDFSSVNGSVSLAANAQADEVSSVNGNIVLGAGAQIREVSAVNGSIELAQQSVVREAVATVNGNVRGKQASVGSLTSVNGAITLSASKVSGNVKTVNGKLKFEATAIDGSIETVWGQVELSAGSLLSKDLVVRKPQGSAWNRSKPPRIVIGANSQVLGRIVLEHAAEVLVHESAQIGGIEGGAIARFKD